MSTPIPICCYCSHWDPRAAINKGATHVICASCQATLLAQLLAGR